MNDYFRLTTVRKNLLEANPSDEIKKEAEAKENVYSNPNLSGITKFGEVFSNSNLSGIILNILLNELKFSDVKDFIQQPQQQLQPPQPPQPQPQPQPPQQTHSQLQPQTQQPQPQPQPQPPQPQPQPQPPQPPQTSFAPVTCLSVLMRLCGYRTNHGSGTNTSSGTNPHR